MNIDIKKSKQISEKILKVKKSKELQEVLDDLCKEIKYYDDKKNKPSDDLTNNDNYQKSEVSNIKWFTYEETKKIIRPYSLEKLKIIENINKTLNNFYLYNIK